MDYVNPDALVDGDWLERHLEAPDVRVVDATYFLPAQDRDARGEYEELHIPGAVFFDIDDIADPASALPHMAPDPHLFAEKAGALGIGDGVRVVIYDGNGGPSAAHRAWWMLRLFGHEDVSVLDGGLPQWFRDGRPTTDDSPVVRPHVFTAHMNHFLLRDREQMLANLETRREQVVDARPAGRFRGEAEESWPCVQYGHIPGSFNVPFTDLLDPRTLRFRPAAEIRDRFLDSGVDLEKPITLLCGSGVTACAPALALYLIGRPDVAVYDGSWAEWGMDESLPVEKGDG